MKRPTDAEIRKIVKWLEKELGLSIYGPCINFKGFIAHPGYMDYTATDIIKYEKLLEKYPNGPTEVQL